MVNQYSLDRRVLFIGEKSLDKLYSYIKGAACVVVPSREEGGGTINIEAQACGAFIIASNTGGIPEYILEGKQALLFKSGDVQDLYEKMNFFLGRKERYKLLDNEAEFIGKFSWENIGSSYLKAYEDVRSEYIYTPLQTWGNISERLAEFFGVRDE